jgi:hypothetical protein
MKLGDTKEAARFLNVSTSFLNKARVYGGPAAPPYIALGRTIRYDLDELAEWARRHRRTSTADNHVHAGA